ncbi:MAG TPA: hypothetical protein VFW50_21810 [Streptosporangiaceae bacterium]|nr:hypothetical protein [Streptosporangiaceae bacterium]
MATGLTASVASAATAHAAGSAAAAAPAAPAAAAGKLTSTVTGTFTNADGQGTFAGTFTPQKFSVANGVLEATGLLKGTMTDANGTKLGTVSQTVTMPVSTGATASGATANATTQQAALACNVLDLVLGPLNLNLLGLVVTLNQVHLNITAVPGAGNLLGNLLCAVAGLLNGGGLSGVLGQIASLLNQILALL